MQDFDTFYYAGWDMVGESTNGTDDIWVMLPYQYPTFYAGYEDSVITSVADVPGDQGHLIELSWNRSGADTFYSMDFYYSVWRLVPEGRSLADDATIIYDPASFVAPENGQEVILIDREDSWAFLINVPAIMADDYTIYVSTLVDSCAILLPEDYISIYKVLYHSTNFFQSSESASGYSVDNIAPYATSGVTLAFGGTRTDSATITWNEVTEGGYNGNSYPEENGVWYRVYAGNTPDFVCEEINLLQTTQNTSITVDPTDVNKRFYKIVVSDQP